MGDGLDSSDAGSISSEGYLENLYRVHRPDADSERQQSGEHFEDVLQEQEDGESKEQSDKKSDKKPNPLPNRPPEPIHDDVHLSAPAQRILDETVHDKNLEELIKEEEAENPEPAPPASNGHIDLLA